MVGPDHAAHADTCYCIRHDHALARFHVTEHEIFLKVIDVWSATAFGRQQHRIRRVLDIDGKRFVPTDEFERPGSVIFVPLDAIGQSNGEEPRLLSTSAQTILGKLCEPAGCGRVDASADTEHIAAKSLRSQIVAEESHAPRVLDVDIELAWHAKFLYDGLLPRIGGGSR